MRENGIAWQGHDYGDLNVHLTLARFLPKSLVRLPPLERKISWSYRAESLDLMESHLRSTGAVYEKLFSVDF